jgi:hypothetical protein
MPLIRRFAALASAAAAARSYARRHPDKVNGAAAKVGKFVDTKTKGKYRRQIDSAHGKVRAFTGGR